MKKIMLLVFLAALILGGSLFAQQSSHAFKESEFYYFNFPIEKIYIHRLGYVVIYRKGANQMTRTFIPGDWFVDVSGKGELIGLGTGSEWPSMSVYYKNGEFSHVRLRVRRNRGHETWGVIPMSANIDEHFKDIEEVKLEF